MSIRSFQDFHRLNEGKKLKDWQYTGTVSVGSNNAIYYQYPNNVKYYVSVTPEELEDYLEGGSLKKKLEKQWADSGKAMARDEFEAKYLPKGPQGLGKYLSQGGRMWDHVEHNDLNEADTWTVYYKKGSFGREVVKSGLSKQAATRLYNKLSADIPSEYDGVEMVMEAVSNAQIRKVMKLAKDRPAPFAVVAVKGGKVVAQDIDIKTWELVLAHYREMAKAHPDAKIHVEDAEGQSVMESALGEARFSFAGMMSDIEKKKEAAMAARKAYTDYDGYSKTYKVGKKLDDLYAYRSRIMQDMEQEAEPEGGRIADRYGKQLNDLDAKISKLEDTINEIGDRERELEKRYQAAMDALKQARLAMKSAMQNESLDEANGTIAKGAYSFADYFGIPVSKLKGFKFDGTDDVEELHKALGRASSNIKGTENIYRTSITESADMLPSYEVLIGLATVMGALDLAQAARGGDSIIVDVAKALKAELGDKLEAAGAEAKRVVSKFKNDPKVKEIIMDAEEEVSESINEAKAPIKDLLKKAPDHVKGWAKWAAQHKDGYWWYYDDMPKQVSNVGWTSYDRDGYQWGSDIKTDPKDWEKSAQRLAESVKESKRSTGMKISLFEEYFNEAKSDITPGSRVEVTGQSIGNMDKTLQGEVTRKNSNGTYEVSLDNGDMADYKADELKLIESVKEDYAKAYGSAMKKALNRPNFNQLAYISSAEYQKVKKLKNFNAADWKWDSKKDLYKNVRMEESVNEARTIIKTKGKRLAIDKEDLERLKSGKDIVGYSTKYPGQEEWILAIDKWEIEESVNEATETGLMVVPRTNADANKIKQWVDKSGMYGEWNAREGYFLFPEEEDGFDELEAELTKELDGLGVNYHIEGIFESKKSNQMSIKKFESYFDDDQLNEAASGDLIKKMDKALEDFEETLGDLEFYWGQLSIAADKIGKAMAGGDDSKEMRQAWYRASMAQRNAAKKAMKMLK
jgi:hypothetical protein